jgi:hypothetical protein
MKKCPDCNRTYPDETLAFCLVDGAVLSAPFNSEPTLVLPHAVTGKLSAQAPQASYNKQSSSPRFLYVVILVLAILGAGSVVALFYERNKPGPVPDNPKALETPRTTSSVSDHANPETKKPVQTPSRQTKADSSETVLGEDLNGEWELVNTVESSSYPKYINARAAFRIFIKQVGEEITGEGEKTWISGGALESNEHTPIHLTGFIRGNSVEATFVEEGLKRKSSGRFVWKLEENGRLSGTFVATAADSSGISVMTKK